MHLHTSNSVKIVDSSLVNKILEQGQKLRNAMVGSILKNDPFNTDIIYSKHFNTPKTSSINLNSPKSDSPITLADEKRLEAYIKGEYMTKDDEQLAIDTLRSMSAPDLCKTTERSLYSNCNSSCKCYTCETYNSNNLYCDLRRKNKTRLDKSNICRISDVARDIQERYNNENKNLLKYVDSLKVSINSLTLNETGNRKVTGNESKVPYNFCQTYFLEYTIPDCMFNKSTNKSKVNSGLDSYYVRFCSRRNSDIIHFKQITIHEVKNLDKFNLDECGIQFKISYRTQKQKNVSTLGFAKFSLGSFLLSKNLVCSRNLLVHLNETSPIIVGNLKVSLSLGCGKLYFGQEFIDAVCSVNTDAVVLDSDDSTNQLSREESCSVNLKDSDNIKELTYHNKQIEDENKHIFEKRVPNVNTFSKTFKKRENENVPKSAIKFTKGSEKIVKPLQNLTAYKSKQNQIYKDEIKISTIDGIKPQISEKEKQVLFGFLYISEVQYLSPPINTYITCRPFCQSETSCSKLITNSSNPVFNFAQIVPLIYEDELLQLFRENYMVIEFWEKIDSTDIVIGLTKISLHQFYLAYRSPVFVKYLSKNKLPVIDTDWWEPIYRLETGKILGQVQILVALGTEDQILNLKTDRGFANNVVKAKFTPSQYNTKFESKIADEFIKKPFSTYKFRQEANTNDILRRKNQVRFKQNPDVNKVTTRTLIQLEDQLINSVDKAVNTSPKTVPASRIQKSDIGTQSNLEMDKTVESQDKDKISPTQEMLGNFLNQLMAHRQKNVCVENSTNTDTVETARSNCIESVQNAQHNTNLKLKKTTDLLDSLQKALSLDGVSDAKIIEHKPGTFKATITVESANNLPSRKKCKSKRSRNRSIKNDNDVLPSCYVTFETSESDLKMTPVVMKSTNPTWSYRCNVHLSEDLLTNGQRRLIFKVWRKATNTVLTPNMQTDVVLGFAAVDLSVLLAGFPNVKGWFNIIDFTGKCNGQINIHISPLENLSKYSTWKEECNCDITENIKKESAKIDNEPSELFSRALKRKFSELDEITQRLRLRLSKVTNDDSDGSSDGAADDFDRDINTLCVEEDFDLIDFEQESKKLNMSHKKENGMSNETSTSRFHTLLTINESDGNSKASENVQMTDENKTSGSNTATSLCQDAGSVLGLSSSGSDKEKELSTLDKHLQEGKQKIDTLLEKLSLISADTNNTFASRYVSGCSLNNDCNALNIDTEAILKELDHSSRPNIQSSLGFEPLNFQQLYGGSCDSDSSKKSGSINTPTSNSDTSLITNFSDCRLAPDGQGNTSDERVVRK